MGGGTTTTITTFRFLTLLSSSPLPLFHRPCSFLLLLRRLSYHRTSLLLSPSPITLLPKCSHQPVWDGIPYSFSKSTPFSQHPWPEFLHFVNWVSTSGYINANDDVHNIRDAQHMSNSFLRVANACLAFARAHPDLLWSLPREDIEVIIEDNGSPFLFQNASSTMERMNFFRPGRTDDVLDSEKPNTVDLMEFLLSYAHFTVGYSSKDMDSRVEASVRRLFSELAKTKDTFVESVSTANKYSATYGQVPRSLGISVDMKKGDWICPRCSFMNFAKNSQCLECKESRPKKFITGGEWECPQCDFFNCSRNVVCLRCDCKKPESNPFTIAGNNETKQTWFTKIHQLEEESDANNAWEDVLGEKSPAYPSRQNVNSGEQSRVLNSRSNDYEREQTEKSERWFKKVAELHNVNDLPSAISDEDFPEIMPMRKGENRFVVGKKKDRSLTSPMYKRKAAMEQTGNNNYVPFVPFPPDFFAKDKAQGDTESTTSSQQTSSNFKQNNDADETQKPLESNLSTPDSKAESENTSESESSRESWRMKSLEGSAVKEPDPLDMSEEAKAQRWFRRVAQIKDISELSQIPDEDFPSIMPMRKGVNRFVVSKRKTPLERRLTSSQYRRNLPNSDGEGKGL